VKRRLAEQEAEREAREWAWRIERAARDAAERARLKRARRSAAIAAFRPIDSAADAVDKDGSLVHAADCERRWGAAHDPKGRLRGHAHRSY